MPGTKGAPIHPDSGRYVARRDYPELGTCERCGVKPARERHHVNGDTFDNRRENLAFLCNRCHKTVDGRLEAMRKRSTAAAVDAAAALKRASPTCRNGHDFTPESTYITPLGRRACRLCANERRRRSKSRET